MLTGYMWMGVASAAVAEGELVLYCMELGCSLAEGTHRPGGCRRPHWGWCECSLRQRLRGMVDKLCLLIADSVEFFFLFNESGAFICPVHLIFAVKVAVWDLFPSTDVFPSVVVPSVIMPSVVAVSSFATLLVLVTVFVVSRLFFALVA